MQERRQRVVYDKKWIKFLSRARLFRYLPFIEFALGAGSLAVGNVKENSDFDVIVGARSGRIFTARFFAILTFGLFGWRRTRLSHREAASDKICLNHFATSEAYSLRGPYTDSWRELYRSLVPVWGYEEKIEEFRSANTHWINEKDISSTSHAYRQAGSENNYFLSGTTFSPPPSLRGLPWQSYNNLFINDLRYCGDSISLIKKSLEFILSGFVGDRFEGILKYLQIKKIEKSLGKDSPGYAPRIIYNDFELEFHPDRKKFENS